ncbi:hypothetical protein OROMI_003427 [Orobanche minor]
METMDVCVLQETLCCVEEVAGQIEFYVVGVWNVLVCRNAIVLGCGAATTSL